MKCAHLILSAGIACVVFETPYRLPDGAELLARRIPTRRFPEPWGQI
jgi:hypothetical protein